MTESTAPERRRILWLSDHPLVPSGVGIQAKYVIQGLLDTKQYSFLCLGGAIRHPDYTLQEIAPEVYGPRNWLIQPVDGHGNKEQLRRMIAEYRPHAIVMFTDPRFFTWVWEMEDEIRSQCPLVYWHVWDNDPAPEFNRPIYEATDYVISLSLKTHGLLQSLKYPRDRTTYIPHAVPADIFKPISDEEVTAARQKFYGPFADREFIVMWNNRNARRKMTGDVMEAFARFAHKVGKKRTALLMHTASDDQEGQDVKTVSKRLGIEDILLLSEQRIPPEHINVMYNCSDCVINLSNNEGFGLGTLESLMAGTPIVLNMTGGLQFQIGDWWCDLDDFSDQDKLTKIAKSRRSSHRWWGVPVWPVARNLVGSQQVPYIYDDRINDQHAADAIEKLFEMGRPARRALGLQAREWAIQKFGMSDMISSWAQALDKAIGAYSNRGKMSMLHLAAI